MIGWTIDELVGASGGELIGGESGLTPALTGAAIDSREIEGGMVFFALPGERVDGRRFLNAARERGAAAAVVSAAGLADFEQPEDLAIVAVADPVRALWMLAEAHRERLDRTRIVAVTGSNGKTTTVRLIEAALIGGDTAEPALRGTRSQKSYNNDLGVPLTLLNADPSDDYLISEIGTSSHGEIGPRSKLVQPHVAVITSIGRAHLDGLGSVEGIAKEKASIADGLSAAGTFVIPAGVSALEEVVNETKQARPGAFSGETLVRVGTGGDVTARVIETDAERMRFEVATDETQETFAIPMLGAHNAHNAAIAVVVARMLGADDGTIRAGLARAVGESMRLSVEQLVLGDRQVRVLNDAYNANPDSMAAAIEVLSGQPVDDGGCRIAVLGDLLELGGETDVLHDEIVGLVADRATIDRVVLVGPFFAAAAARHGRASGMTTVADAGAAAELLAAEIRSGDVVLLKASRGLALERVLDDLRAACR